MGGAFVNVQTGHLWIARIVGRTLAEVAAWCVDALGTLAANWLAIGRHQTLVNIETGN